MIGTVRPARAAVPLYLRHVPHAFYEVRVRFVSSAAVCLTLYFARPGATGPCRDRRRLFGWDIFVKCPGKQRRDVGGACESIHYGRLTSNVRSLSVVDRVACGLIPAHWHAPVAAPTHGPMAGELFKTFHFPGTPSHRLRFLFTSSPPNTTRNIAISTVMDMGFPDGHHKEYTSDIDSDTTGNMAMPTMAELEFPDDNRDEYTFGIDSDTNIHTVHKDGRLVHKISDDGSSGFKFTSNLTKTEWAHITLVKDEENPTGVYYFQFGERTKPLKLGQWLKPVLAHEEGMFPPGEVTQTTSRVYDVTYNGSAYEWITSSQGKVCSVSTIVFECGICGLTRPLQFLHKRDDKWDKANRGKEPQPSLFIAQFKRKGGVLKIKIGYDTECPLICCCIVRIFVFLNLENRVKDGL